MKKILTGALLLGALSATAYAEEATREPFKLDPRGTVEIGFEWEEYTSSNNQAKNDFVLPYIKTKTYFNQTTPYYIEANHSYRHRSDSSVRENDKRRRYELFVGGYEFKKGDFTWKPKVGFRHETYEDAADRTRTYWRIYPGVTYQLTDRAQLFVGGWVAPVSDDRDYTDENGVKQTGEETTYKHELEFGVKYKLTSQDVLNVNIYNDRETFERSGEDTKTNTEYQLRLRLDHKFSNNKTAAYGFIRLGLYRDSDFKNSEKETDKSRKRNRYGVGISQKINDSFSVKSEVYYESAGNGSNYDGNKAKNRKENTNKMFVKAAVVYKY